MKGPGACVLGLALLMASVGAGAADSQPPDCLAPAEFLQKGIASGAVIEVDRELPAGLFRYKFEAPNPRITYAWLGQKDDGTAVASFQPPGQEPSNQIPYSTLGVVWGDHLIFEQNGAFRSWLLFLLVHEGRETAVSVEVLEIPDRSVQKEVRYAVDTVHTCR